MTTDARFSHELPANWPTHVSAIRLVQHCAAISATAELFFFQLHACGSDKIGNLLVFTSADNAMIRTGLCSRSI